MRLEPESMVMVATSTHPRAYATSVAENRRRVSPVIAGKAVGRHRTT
jgi:hypothetical protein